MCEPIRTMLAKYHCHFEHDYINALKEIFQEIALLGLWRAKFYEKAAFYGGSALRILYGLDRFSEGLDFTLLPPDDAFDLTRYNQAMADELESFGFQVRVETKVKNSQSAIESVFIKADSRKQLIVIDPPSDIIQQFHSMHTIKIKMEVDTDPPGHFTTEVKHILNPIPFSVKSLTQPDLFAGKIHAILCRPWQKRVKGRDWHDFVWYVSRGTPVGLLHLKERLVQSKAWELDNVFTKKDLCLLLADKIKQTDFSNAKEDVGRFISDEDRVSVWSQAFFLDLLPRLHAITD